METFQVLVRSKGEIEGRLTICGSLNLVQAANMVIVLGRIPDDGIHKFTRTERGLRPDAIPARQVTKD